MAGASNCWQFGTVVGTDKRYRRVILRLVHCDETERTRGRWGSDHVQTPCWTRPYGYTTKMNMYSCEPYDDQKEYINHSDNGD